MPPLAQPPACPAGMEVCPVLSEFLRLQEECRQLRELSQTDPISMIDLESSSAAAETV